MPRPNRLPFQAALTLLLALSVPLPLQAVTGNGGGGNAQTTGPTKQAPSPAPVPEVNGPAGPEPGTPPPSPQVRGADPGPASAGQPDPGLSALEDQLQALKQEQGFSLLKPPGSLLEILALAALPLAVLALALALIQAQRNRRVLDAFHQRLKDLRQEVSNRPVAAPVPMPPTRTQGGGITTLPPAVTAEATTRLQLAIDQTLPQPVVNQEAPALPVAPTVPQPPAPAPQPPTIHDWISALNAGQRDNLRAHPAVQLNITKESEDAIQMGRSDATCLEEVVAGGSYLRVSCGTDHWLLPTERTLSSFRNFQPIKGLFTYQAMISGEPQVLQACRLEQTASGWRVSEPGVIRVAG